LSLLRCIISCDSLLVYKDFNIGTAKPTLEEQKNVPHYGIDLVDANTNFTAADYVRVILPIILDLLNKDKPIIIVGGTGFYLKALLFGIWQAPPSNSKIREELEAIVYEYEKKGERDKGLKEVHSILEKLDSEYAKKIHYHDLYRTIRAIEIIKQTNVLLSEQIKKQNQNSLLEILKKDIPIIAIDLPKETLLKQITLRAQKMIELGLIEETKNLLNQYAPWFFTRHELEKLPRPFLSVGYHEVINHLINKNSIEECINSIILSTKKLSKKQRTFFNGLKPKLNFEWIDLEKNYAFAESSLLEALK